jgi:cobalt-zinc-cadmium efflux system membrane fusion protein
MTYRKRITWMILLLAALALALGFRALPKAETPAVTNAAAAHDDHDHGDHGEAHAEPHSGQDHGPAAADLDDLFGDDAAKADPDDDHAGHNHGKSSAVPEGDCPEHGIPEAEDALCQPQLLEGLRPGQGLKVRLAAADAAERIGIRSERPTAISATGAPLNGRVLFNRDRLARLSAPLTGVVKSVSGELGQQVKAGQSLAEIAAPEIAGLRAALQTAESRATLAASTVEREADLFARGISSRQELQQAEAERDQARSAVTQARQQLADYGLAGGATLPVRAPFAGTVVERTAVLGETVAPGAPLFTIADLRSLWLELSVPESRLLDLQPGATLAVSFVSLPGRSFPARIFWIDPALDEKTRMLKALAEIDNADGLLKSGLFGDARFNVGAGAALTVPAEALQVIDGASYLFVALEPDLFELRRVEAGRAENGRVAIVSGLAAEEKVVSGQGFALKSEILKSRLGASCADH